MIADFVLFCILGAMSFLSGLFLFVESFQYYTTWNSTLLERLICRTLFIALMSLGIMLLITIFFVR